MALWALVTSGCLQMRGSYMWERRRVCGCGDYADAGQKAFAANTCRGCAADIWDTPKCAIFLQADFIFFASDADAFLSFSTRLMKIYT
jgi:hypothetical protein